MNHQKIQFIRGVIADGVGATRSPGVISLELCNEGYGAHEGRQIVYQTNDVWGLMSLLGQHGISIHASEDSSRAAAQGKGLTEKLAANAPHLNDVAIQLLTNGIKVRNEARLPTDFGYVVVKANEIAQFSFDAFLVVENLETFQQLRQYKWLMAQIRNSGARVLAIFGGDNIFKENVVRQVLVAGHQHVWSFPDLDPSGLSKAASLPRMSRLIFPPMSFLTAKLIERDRRDLFSNQYEHCYASLNASNHPEIKKYWALIQNMGIGLNQESLKDIEVPDYA